MSDKQQAWNDLIKLISDKNDSVRCKATSVLDSVFIQVPDKQQAWNDLHRLTKDEDRDVRSSAAYAFGSVFSHVQDKQQAWNDLIRLTSDEDSDVRFIASRALDSAFSHVQDKQQAWNDLIKLISDKNDSVRCKATYVLDSVFIQVPDKQQAWNDLEPIRKVNYLLFRQYILMVKRKIIHDYMISDKFWTKIEPLLPLLKPKKKPERPQKDDKRILSGIFYLLRTGCQWKALPRFYGAPSTVHDRFQEWQRSGLFEQMWKAGLMDTIIKTD